MKLAKHKPSSHCMQSQLGHEIANYALSACGRHVKHLRTQACQPNRHALRDLRLKDAIHEGLSGEVRKQFDMLG